MNALEALRAAAAGAPAAKTDSTPKADGTKLSAAHKPHELLAELKAVLHAGYRHHRNVTPWFGFPGLKQGCFPPFSSFATGESKPCDDGYSSIARAAVAHHALLAATNDSSTLQRKMCGLATPTSSTTTFSHSRP